MEKITLNEAIQKLKLKKTEMADAKNLNISRPRLYKLINEYENGIAIPADIKSYFDGIVSEAENMILAEEHLADAPVTIEKLKSDIKSREKDLEELEKLLKENPNLSREDLISLNDRVNQIICALNIRYAMMDVAYHIDYLEEEYKKPKNNVRPKQNGGNIPSCCIKTATGYRVVFTSSDPCAHFIRRRAYDGESFAYSFHCSVMIYVVTTGYPLLMEEVEVQEGRNYADFDNLPEGAKYAYRVINEWEFYEDVPDFDDSGDIIGVKKEVVSKFILDSPLCPLR